MRSWTTRPVSSHDMSGRRRELFTAMVPLERLHPLFVNLAQEERFQAARALITEIFADFVDIDHSFVREFQTSGFDARLFELALFAYLREQQQGLDRSHGSPDFLLSGPTPVAIEVTTTNPVQGLPTPPAEQTLADLQTGGEAFVHQIGKALRRKLLHQVQGGRYWELSHLQQVPFVVAVGAFHTTLAQVYPMGLVAQYLYGTRDVAEHQDDGTLTLIHQAIAEHVVDTKPIPSGLFRQPEAAHLSGVLFSNNHTVWMFNRIGAERGLAAPDTLMIRTGFCINPHPNASRPVKFTYIIDSDIRPEMPERFNDGLHLFINPWARVPLDPTALPEVTVHRLRQDGAVESAGPPGLHPIQSRTGTLMGDEARAFRARRQAGDFA